MGLKTEQDYINYALKWIERGKSNEQIIQGLQAEGLREFDAKRLFTKAYKAAHRDENRESAIWMIIGGILGIIITIAIIAFFIFVAKGVGMIRPPRWVNTIAVGAIMASLGSIFQGVKKLREL